MTLRPFATALEGVTVLELDGRLAVGLCGQLLRCLGATVIRWEDSAPQFPDLIADASARAVLAVRDRKLCETGTDRWDHWLAKADVVLLDAADACAPALVADAANPQIICTISPYGIDAPEGTDASEVELQAAAGLMAATGEVDGPPEMIGLPLVEMVTAVNAAATIIAALRVKGSGHRHLDIGMFDSSLALFTTFIGTVHAGKATGYRLGSAHHLCAPWNAYPTRDGWVQLCSTKDDEWHRVLDVIGRSERKADPRFANAALRVQHRSEIDGIVSGWTRMRDAGSVVKSFEDAGLAVGNIRRVVDLVADGNERLTRAAGRDGFLACALAGDGHASNKQPFGSSAKPVESGKGPLPLAGIRVLEVGAFTAGPLAGRYLAELGAEVIKIEPATGEVTRQWVPQVDGWSIFFVNANIGKRYISLDLRQESDKARFLQLAASADVVLTNLKSGALDKLGVGSNALQALFPRLIFCGLTGFGAEGEGRAALDTVIQAEGGLMSVIGDGQRPVRVGVSIADQGAAHAAPLIILAALAERDRTGKGSAIDLSMLDVVVWLTRLAWPAGVQPLRPWARVMASDGYVMVAPGSHTAPQFDGTVSTRSELVDAYRAAGGRAAAVLEMDEVFSHPVVARRNLVLMLQSAGGALPVLRAPHRLNSAAPSFPRICAPPDADGASLT